MTGLGLEGDRPSGGGFLSGSIGLARVMPGDVVGARTTIRRSPAIVPALAYEFGIRIGPYSGTSLRLSLDGVTFFTRGEAGSSTAQEATFIGYFSVAVGFRA
jgi:hypothetical protein